jgi:hypothetical protein
MASSSHRKCQYRGEGCMGTAHAGHDQCAHCYFQYIKPALQAERAEMKRRRALKQQYQLSQSNRALINEVDLQEPQIVEHRSGWETSLSVQDAVKSVVLDAEFDREIENGIDAGKTPEQIANEMILKAALPRGLPHYDAVIPPPKEETPVSDAPPNFRPPLTLEERQEVIDAYVAGETIAEIMRAYNIGTTRLYEVLDSAGVPRRGTNRGPNREPKKEQFQMPTPTAAAPTPNGTEPALTVTKLTEWVVTYTVVRTETTIVAAKSFNDAAATITDGDVISVAKKLP